MRLILSLFVLACSLPLAAQKQELGLTLGYLSGPERTLASGQSFQTSAGIAFQANYGYRFIGGETAALFGEVHFIANPLREISQTTPGLSRDYATLYVTPGLRVKFNPTGRFQPYIAGGGGYALYENSRLTQGGAPNPAGRFTHRGAVDFGVGADLHFWRFVYLRGEIRDFYTGNPGFNVAVRDSRQHNVVAGGGLGLHW
jgi:hypothetical protein